MRITVELIEDLMEESRRFSHVSIAVFINEGWSCVDWDEENPLDCLDQLVQAGGKPIGMFGFSGPGDFGFIGSVTCYAKIFSEYEGDQKMQRCFADFLEWLCGPTHRIDSVGLNWKAVSSGHTGPN